MFLFVYTESRDHTTGGWSISDQSDCILMWQIFAKKHQKWSAAFTLSKCDQNCNKKVIKKPQPNKVNRGVGWFVSTINVGGEVLLTMCGGWGLMLGYHIVLPLISPVKLKL